MVHYVLDILSLKPMNDVWFDSKLRSVVNSSEISVFCKRTDHIWAIYTYNTRA